MVAMEMSRYRFLIVLTVLGASVAGLLFSAQWKRGQVPVKVGRVERGEMLITVSATSTGTIESESQLTISGQAVGRLLRFLVEEGDQVRKGQILALLDSEEARAQLILAEANLQAARARLEQAEAGVRMLATQIHSEISQTTANLQQAEAELERVEGLYREGFASQQQLDAARATYQVAKASHQAALARRDERMVKDREVAALRAAVQQMEASCRLARVQLGHTEIRSPAEGIVSEKLIEEGELVRVGVPVLRLVDPRRLYVKATIDEFDAQKVRLGQRAVIRVDAYPGETLEGEVYHISPVVSGGKLETRTFSVKVSLNSERALKAGMSADVEIVISRLEDAVFVPSLAVVEREAHRLVLLVEGSRVRLRPILAGDSNWTYVQVKQGLNPGDWVVLNPDLSKLREGTRVKPEFVSGGSGR